MRTSPTTPRSSNSAFIPAARCKAKRSTSTPASTRCRLLAVVACFASSPTRLYNGAIARCKESDRIAAIAAELRKMGGRLEEHADGLTIYPSKLKGLPLSSHSDHRIALSLTVAALGASSPSHIEGFSWIAKSYPHFVSQFQQLGANIEPKNGR